PARPFPKCLQPGPQTRPPLLRAMACMAIAVGLYLPLVSWISSKTQVPAAERAETARLFVNPDECRPEPGARLAFQLGLAFLPAALLGLSFVVRQLEKRGWFQVPLDRLWIVDLLAGILLLFLVCLSFLEKKYFHIYRSLFFEHPLATFPLFL